VDARVRTRVERKKKEGKEHGMRGNLSAMWLGGRAHRSPGRHRPQLPPCRAAPFGGYSDGGPGRTERHGARASPVRWGPAKEAARLHRHGDSGMERCGPSAPRRHNPRGPPSGASSAAGPPLSDAGRRTGAGAPCRTPGTAATWPHGE
jgi:hypothetical protein